MPVMIMMHPSEQCLDVATRGGKQPVMMSSPNPPMPAESGFQAIASPASPIISLPRFFDVVA